MIKSSQAHFELQKFHYVTKKILFELSEKTSSKILQHIYLLLHFKIEGTK